MGKGRSPTPDELKFIYQLLAEGYSDKDVLAKYEELNKHGKLASLPHRSDIRFIRQRRKEFEAAKEVLRGLFTKEANPHHLKHWQDLAVIAGGLFSNLTKIRNYDDYDNVDVVGDVLNGGKIEFNKQPAPFHFSMSPKEDPQQLEKIDSYLAKCLLQHLKKVSPIFGSLDSWQSLPDKDTADDIMNLLLFVEHGGVYDGTTCEICESWYQEG